MYFNSEGLVLDELQVSDALGQISLADIPEGPTGCELRLKPEASPMMKKLWMRALADVMTNDVEVEGKRYLGAGAKFGVKVFTRDIAYSGILGVNRTHPELMRQSLRHTREVRLKIGIKVPVEYESGVEGLEIEKTGLSKKDFLAKYHSNCFLRRTDDVVWVWAYYDLLFGEGQTEVDPGEIKWLYEMGQAFYNRVYSPWFDPSDGLYKGQASFIDIHFPGQEQATGYPREGWTFWECIQLKATCTNALHYKAKCILAELAERLGDDGAAENWSKQAEALKAAMRSELRDEAGKFLYYKLPDGSLEPRRAALGTALAIITGVVDGEEAKATIEDYPITDFGVPLIDPPRDYPIELYYHNSVSWPFVDGYFMWARQLATGEDNTAQTAALLARVCRPDGTFHEVTRLPDGDVRCSASQLWSAAAFINVCYRAGLVAG